MTIEERASAKRSVRRREQIDNNAPTEKFMADVYEHGYIDGATDQKKIDIEKACEWLRNYIISSEWNEFAEIHFRKAMEE